MDGSKTWEARRETRSAAAQAGTQGGEDVRRPREVKIDSETDGPTKVGAAKDRGAQSGAEASGGKAAQARAGEGTQAYGEGKERRAAPDCGGGEAVAGNILDL